MLVDAERVERAEKCGCGGQPGGQTFAVEIGVRTSAPTDFLSGQKHHFTDVAWHLQRSCLRGRPASPGQNPGKADADSDFAVLELIDFTIRFSSGGPVGIL